MTDVHVENTLDKADAIDSGPRFIGAALEAEELDANLYSFPRGYLSRRLNDTEYRLKKCIKNGILCTLNVADGGSEPIQLLFDLAQVPDKTSLESAPLLFQSKFGIIKLYNGSKLLEVLSGIDFSFRGSPTPGLVEERLSLAITRLPPEFTKLFGFLSLVNKERIGIDEKDDDTETNLTQTQLLSLTLRHENFTLQCYMEAYIPVWENFIRFGQFDFFKSKQADPAPVKQKLICSVGHFNMSKKELLSLEEGEVVFLDVVNVGEASQISLKHNDYTLSVVPEPEDPSTFKVAAKTPLKKTS